MANVGNDLWGWLVQDPSNAVGGAEKATGAWAQNLSNLVQNDVYGPARDVLSLTKGLSGAGLSGGSDPKADPKAKPKETAAEKAAAAEATYQTNLENQIKAVDTSPWTQLSNSLVQQYQEAEAPVAAAISGTNIPGIQTSAENTALGLLGQGQNSADAKWLGQATAMGQAAAAPATAAMAQEGAQYAAEAGPISKAIADYGQANALEVSTAPEQAWLNALASHITSNLSYQGVVPTAALPSLPPSVAKALQLSGGYLGSTAAGTTPLQDVGPAAGGGSKSNVDANTALSAAGPGTIPGVSPGGGP